MFPVRAIAAILLLLFLLPGCTSLIQEPRIKIIGTSLTGLDLSGIDLEFHLGINNPNNFDLSLLGYSYDLHVMALPFSSGGRQATVIFPSGQETEMRLPVHLRFSDLLEIIKLNPDLDKLPYRINTRLHLKYPLGELVIPVEKSDTLAIPEQYRPGAAINLLRDALRGIR